MGKEQAPRPLTGLTKGAWRRLFGRDIKYDPCKQFEVREIAGNESGEPFYSDIWDADTGKRVGGYISIDEKP